MTNTVSLVINALIASITTFLQTDIAMVFMGVIITAIVVRILITIMTINKRKGGYKL